MQRMSTSFARMQDCRCQVLVAVFFVITQAKIEEHGGNLETNNKEEFHALLDIAASTYDIEGTQPAGKGTKRLKQAVLDSSAFRMGRILIASRM